MGIQNILSWYQKKIGTYDKQQWEKTVEQKILHTATNVRLMGVKTTKPKRDLIDLDLVRGSSFPKAKPKHGIVTVTRLATLRLIFLPWYSKWWAQQTSRKVFALLLFLYVLQLLNIAIFCYNFNKQDHYFLEKISFSEIIIPVFMMFILSVMQSEIVSTHCPEKPIFQKTRRRSKIKRRRYNYTSGYLESDGSTAPQRSSRNNIDLSDGRKLDVKRKFYTNINLSNLKINTNVSDQNLDEQESKNGAQDDDGFESLNGNASSENGDETNANNKRGVIINSVEERTSTVSSSSEGEPDTDSESQPNTTRMPNKIARKYRRWFVPNHGVSADSDRSTLLTESVTTNSEDCSYSSEYVQSDTDAEMNNNEHSVWDYDRVSCTIWENTDMKKADMSVLDISSAIIAKVESMPETLDYFYSGVVFSTFLSLVPSLYRLLESVTASHIDTDMQLSAINLSFLIFEKLSGSLTSLLDAAFGSTVWERAVLIISLIERWSLSCLFFFLLAVAERTFKQRFLYAKLFSHLTSSQRARKSDVPHFRLNKVRNIKTWLSVRSYLKRRGPQRSVDVIVSTAFIITVLLIAFISMELFKDSVTIHSQYNFEAVSWCVGLGIFLLRFMTLGTKINQKNRNLSVLITEQINLYLQIEQKPHKKDKLMVANSVLKLAADLLKELESPFKISGLSANPYLYNITKVVLVSALSGVLSEMLGFKVKIKF